VSAGEIVRLFVNGAGMSGGSLHGPLARSATPLGAVRTAPRYRFWSCRDEFPGLEPVDAGGGPVPGELYAVEYAVLRDEFLPAEPPELELGIVELADGRGCLGMRVRDDVLERADELLRPIPAGMGWRDYLDPTAATR
jgi:hypothetical protein